MSRATMITLALTLTFAAAVTINATAASASTSTCSSSVEMTRQGPGVAISGHNDLGIYTGISIDVCEAMCFGVGECQSADWKPSSGGTCHLSTASEATTGLQRHPDHYYIEKSTPATIEMTRQGPGVAISGHNDLGIYTRISIDVCEAMCFGVEECQSADWKPSSGGTCHLSTASEATTGLQRHPDHYYIEKVRE